MSSERDEADVRKAKRLQDQKTAGETAMREYRLAQAAARDKTEKLKALRLARDAEHAQAAAQKSSTPPRKRKAARD
jgi:hypothetical protein